MITTRSLASGATLVVESIPSASSVAIQWLVQAGTATDAPDGDGISPMLCEMLFRGAGGLSSREHSDALDRLGVQRSGHAGAYHLQVDATMLGDRLDDALPLMVALLRAPALPEDALDPVRSLCLQSLDGLDDDPQHLVMLRLRERQLPAPINRHGYGDRAVLQSATIEQIRTAWRDRVVPEGCIISAAGAVDADHLAAALDDALAGWSGDAPDIGTLGEPARGRTHITQDTAQLHIAMGWDAPREADGQSMLERLGIAVLSGSTSGRLFTEVRQKRSLCYSVGARYRAGRDLGRVTLYAGTTPERASETLEVCTHEIHRMQAGAERDEFDRAVIGLKSQVVMQGESTPARAGALAYDQFRLGRPRSLDDVLAAIDAIDLDALNDYLAQRSVDDITIVTIGPGDGAAPAAGS